ncbi:z1226 protein [Yersinia intermedia]|jgi:hypothetical protein|nr:hypothetical protein yinte0001_33900 [Yersinia intermedia ATCC 29909]CRY79573.1 Uncharacterised protein [Yersinia intermedia]VDZ59713.1 z1226 protein [Yersinia intermedia]
MSTSLGVFIDEPQVLSDYTDVICSTNIERIVCGRDAVLK